MKLGFMQESPLNVSISFVPVQLIFTTHSRILKVGVLQVQFSYGTPTSPQIESIGTNQVSEDMLPLPGECLDLETETPPVPSKTEPMPKNNQDLDVLPSKI